MGNNEMNRSFVLAPKIKGGVIGQSSRDFKF